MQDVVNAVVFMGAVFGLAALILVFRDRVTLRPNMSAEEREARITKQSNRLARGWGIAFFFMALVALPLHAFGLEEEPLWQRLFYFGLAALVVINFLSSWHDSRKQKVSENEAGKTGDDEQ